MTQGEAKGSRHGDVGLEIGREGLAPITQFIEQLKEKLDAWSTQPIAAK